MMSRRTICCFQIVGCALLLASATAGCRWLKLNGASPDVEQALAAAEAKSPPAPAPGGDPSSPAQATLARDGWNAALAPQPPFPSASGSRWRHGDLEALLVLPVDQQPDFAVALAEANPVTSTNAAICLARKGDARGRVQLSTAIGMVALRRPLRCAAAEALARLSDSAATEDLRKLIDQWGRGPTGTANYAPDLHAELLYGLAERVDAGSDERFAVALKSQEVDVRLAAIRAYTLPGQAALPTAGADLRSDQDQRVRSAALEAMATRHHPLALECVRNALADSRLEVRLTAISCLGGLDKAAAAQSLRQLNHEPEVIRAAVVLAWAKLGEREQVWAAANDDSWRVRQATAEAVVRWADAGGTGLARRLIKDPSTEVQKTMIASLGKWPLEAAVPVLLAALEEGGYMTRKTAAAQLAERWPAGSEFTVDAPPERRTEMVAALRKRWGETHPLDGGSLTAQGPNEAAQAHTFTPEQLHELEQIVRRIQEAPPTGGAIGAALRDLDKYGPALPAALEKLTLERRVVLPDVIFRDVLAKRSAEFDALDRLTSSESLERRQAALKLAEQAEVKSLSWLGVMRLAELGAGESDTLVWNSMMRAVANDPREPTIRLAYAGLTHESGEVRRLACEHLAAFPSPKHAIVLLPALEDEYRSVVLAAVSALGHAGMLDDTRPLERLLATNDHELRLAVAQSLVQLGAAGGLLELERLAHDADPEIRRRTAVVMGSLGDPIYTDSLIALLNDSLGVQVAALEALPKVVGRDIAQQPGNPATDTLERISRWKRWREGELRRVGGEPANK